MAVDPVNLLGANGGELYEEFFAFDDLAAQIQTWLDAAPEDDSDNAKTAFVYWKAFSFKVQEGSAHAARRDTDSVMARQWTSDQRSDWRSLRDFWQSRYEALRTAEDDSGAPSSTRRRSQSVRTSTSWV